MNDNSSGLPGNPHSTEPNQPLLEQQPKPLAEQNDPINSFYSYDDTPLVPPHEEQTEFLPLPTQIDPDPAFLPQNREQNAQEQEHFQQGYSAHTQRVRPLRPEDMVQRP